MDSYDPIDEKSALTDNREYPVFQENQPDSETQVIDEATWIAPHVGQSRQSRLGLGEIMAQLPDWANDLLEEALRALPRGLGLNSNGADEVLRDRIGRYFGYRGGNQAVHWYLEDNDPQGQVPHTVKTHASPWETTRRD